MWKKKDSAFYFTIFIFIRCHFALTHFTGGRGSRATRRTRLYEVILPLRAWEFPPRPPRDRGSSKRERFLSLLGFVSAALWSVAVFSHPATCTVLLLKLCNVPSDTRIHTPKKVEFIWTEWAVPPSTSPFFDPDLLWSSTGQKNT